MNNISNFSVSSLILFVKNNSLILSITFFGIVLIIVLIGIPRIKLKNVSRQLKLNNEILTSLSTEQGIEKHLNQYLNIITPIVEATGYYFYLLDAKSGNYVLKVNRQADSPLNLMTPNNNDIIPNNIEKYKAPLGLSSPKEDEGVSLIIDEEVPLVQLIIKGGLGIIRFGPVRRLSRKNRSELEIVGRTLYPALSMLIAVEKQKHDAELVVATGQVINGLAKSICDVESSNSKMMILAAKMINAEASCLIIKDQTSHKLHFMTGFDSGIESRLRNDVVGMLRLCDLVGLQEFNHIVVNPITRQTDDLEKIPDYLKQSGFQSLHLIKVDGQTSDRVAVFWHKQVSEINENQIVTVKMLLSRLEDLFEHQSKYKELTNSYVGTLRILVDATDNLDPITIGHSELVANYSLIIAKQLNLSEQDVQDIKLAGYFHDIGMIGLSNDILFKPGKYSCFESETMKLHSEVGAAIAESTIANSKVASYIRHHHERWDGYGYPLGLRGEEIPLGARIIAVADMFIAKIGGRKYREPVSFEQAITDLDASAGTQLDPVVVGALLSWFRNKHVSIEREGRSLGPCWSMRCSPSSICKQCIAFNNLGKNCWELEGVNCAAHGNSCSTCFIHTEAIYRANMPIIRQ